MARSDDDPFGFNEMKAGVCLLPDRMDRQGVCKPGGVILTIGDSAIPMGDDDGFWLLLAREMADRWNGA
jgi:hypothetical protein